jgi:lipoprotein-anchoring transpeptidase ErfK/SrfK
MNKASLMVIAAIILFACNNNNKEKKEVAVKSQPAVEKKKPHDLVYTFVNGKAWKAAHKHSDSSSIKNILVANRTDLANIGAMDSILIPSDSTADIQYYLPFPDEVSSLKDVKKILVFSYPAQAFGAYANGILVYAGPTNMGRKKDPTPTGLYYTNWKAEKTTSTFNDEWDLKWNFNIENKEGIGFHQYALPGYPASHSCLRLLEDDAKYLYNWAEQWILKGTDNVLAKGTPVVVFGAYNFGGPKPWLQLAHDPHALDISTATIEKETAAYLNDILAQQQKRDSVIATGVK